MIYIQTATRNAPRQTTRVQPIMLAMIVAVAATWAQPVYALPDGEQIIEGTADFVRDGDTLNIVASDNSIIEYDSFNIAAHETVNFTLPSLDSYSLNRMIGGSTMEILGTLLANGNLILINVGGSIHFGSAANVNVGGLIASTHDIANADFLAGQYLFAGADISDALATSIFQEGLITGQEGSMAILIADAITNSGTITVPLGTVALAAGNQVTVAISGDGLISVAVDAPTAHAVLDVNGQSLANQIDHTGTVTADGGTVLMTAQALGDIFDQAINLDGVVQANAVEERNGIVRIVANGPMYADAAVTAAGGTITIASDELVEIAGSYEAAGGEVTVSSGGDVAIMGDITTAGATTFAADATIFVHGDVTTDSGHLTFQADADLNGTGAFLQDAGTLVRTTTFGDITIASAGASQLGSVASAGDLLLQSAGGAVTYTQLPNATVDALGSLTIGANVTLEAQTTTYDIGAHWINLGNFEAGLSSVWLTGLSASQVLGSTTFYNFGTSTPGKPIDFEANMIQEILGTATFQGSFGNLVPLRSTIPGVPFSLAPTGDRIFRYVAIQDAWIRGPPLTPIYAQNFGNNTNIDFAQAGPVWTGAGISAVWSDALNWDGGFVPGVFDLARFTAASPSTLALINAAYDGTIAGLTLESGYLGAVALGRDVIVTGHVSLLGGTLAAQSYTLTVGGNWTLAGGTFDAGTSTVVFHDASQTSTILGENSFYHLQVTTPNKYLYFEAGKTQTVQGDLTIIGIPGWDGLIRLRSTDQGGVQWRLQVGGAQTVQYVYVGDLWYLGTTPIKTLPSNSFGNLTNVDTDPVWDNSSGDGLWSTDTNWDTNVEPTSSDTVTFNSTSTANSSVDATFTGTIATLNINSGYSGTITLNRSLTVTTLTFGSGTTGTLALNGQTLTVNGTFTINAGTFTGDTGTLNISNGNFSQTGGDFTVPSTSFTIERNFTVSGGTFNNSATITFNGNGGTDDSIITYSGTVPGTVAFGKTAAGADVTVAVGTTVNLGTTPTSTVGNLTNNDTILVAGTWTIESNNSSGLFTNNGTITHSGTGWDINNISLTNSSGATITYGGTAITLDRSFTQEGTFDTTGMTLTFDGNGGTDDSIISATSAIQGNIIINKTAGGSTWTLGSDVTVQGSFTRTEGVTEVPAAAYTLSVQGDFSTSTTGTLGDANLTLAFTGGSNQNITMNAGSWAGPVQINKSGNTAFLTTNFTTSGASGTIDIVEGNFDIQGFTLAAGSTFTVQDGGNFILQGAETIPTAVLNSGSTVTYDGGGTYTQLIAGDNYHHLTFNGSGSWTLDAALDTNGNLTITQGTLDTKSGSSFGVTVGGNWSVGASGVFTARSGIVTFDATDTDNTINPGSSSFYGLTFAGAAGAWDLTTNNATVTNALTITDGTFDLNGLNLTATGATFSNDSDGDGDGGLRLQGGETVTGLTMDTDSGLVTYDGTGTYASGLVAGDSYYNLSFTGSGTWTLDAALTVATGATLTLTAGTLNTSAASNFAVNAGTLLINGGTLTANDSAITLTATSGTLFTRSSGTFTAGTSNVVMNPDAAVTLTSGTITFYDLQLTPTITAGRTYTFGSGAITISNNFDINPTASSALNLEVDMGAAITVTGTTTITRTTSATSNLDTVSGSNYALSTGLLDIATGGTLTANGATITLTGTSGTLFTRTGTFTAGTSTVVFNPDAAVTLTSGTVTFNNVNFTPTITADRAWTLNGDALTINGNVNLNPTASSAFRLTLTQGAAVTIAATKTLTLTGTTSGVSTWDTSSSGNYALTAGNIAVSSPATLEANGSTVTLNGTSGTLLSCNFGTVSLLAATLVITSDADVTLFDTVGKLSLNHLQLTPTLTANRAYTLHNSKEVELFGDLTVNPTASSAFRLTVTQGHTLSFVDASETMTLTGTNAGLSTWNDTVESFGMVLGALDIASAGTFTVSNGDTITFNGTSGTALSNAGTINAGTSTFSFANSSGTILINAGGSSLNNVTFSGAGTKTLSGALDVNGTLTISAGTLDVSDSNYDITVGVNWTDTGAGTFTEGAGTVTFDGTGTINANETFNNVTVNSSGTVTLGAALDVADTLTLTSGTLNTSAASNFAVNAGALLINGGTLTANGSTITLTATSSTLFTRSSGTFTAGTSTVVFNPDAAVTLTSGTITFYNLSLTPTITSARTYTFGSGAITVDNNFDINPTASSALNLEVDMGAAITVTGTTTITRTTSATSNLDTVSGSNYALSTGLLDIATGGTLTANGATITLTGTSGTLFTRTGTFTAGTSTVVFNPDAAVTLTSGTITFYNLSLTPTITAGRTYTFGSGALTISNNFLIQPDASSALALTVNPAANITVTGTTTITRSNSATSTLDLLPSSTTYSLTTGGLTIGAGGTLDNTGVTTANVNVSGNWSNSGTFTAGSSTVTFDGADQTISGSTSFNHLTKTASSAATLTFVAGTTQTITGTMTLQGAAGTLLSLRSDTDGTQWLIDPQSTRTIAYLDVKDSNNINATLIETVGFNVTDSGNNTGWNFPVDATTAAAADLGNDVTDWSPFSFLGLRQACSARMPAGSGELAEAQDCAEEALGHERLLAWAARRAQGHARAQRGPLPADMPHGRIPFAPGVVK